MNLLIILLIYLFIQMFLSMQSLPSPEKTAVKKRDKVPALMEMRILYDGLNMHKITFT